MRVKTYRAPTNFTPSDDREMGMLLAAVGGATLRSIGQEFGVSHERVRQLLRKAGWNSKRTRKELGLKFFGSSRRGSVEDWKRFKRNKPHAASIAVLHLANPSLTQYKERWVNADRGWVKLCEWPV